MSTADVHVVVVGGGFGGIAAALQLQSRGLAFTLIDLRDSFHHNVAALRASLQPGNMFFFFFFLNILNVFCIVFIHLFYISISKGF